MGKVFGILLLSLLLPPIHAFFVSPLSTDTLCSALFCSEEDALQALERIWKLDEKFGEGCGAAKERAKLLKIFESWEKAVEEEEEREEDEENFDDDIENPNTDQDGAYIDRHDRNERVAIFGGDPRRRKQTVAKRLAPYKSLDQFGTPRDVGSGDLRNLVRKIKNNSFDVVYIWTRFGCHGSRDEIRCACRATNTRCFEIQSLSRIRKG